ncbi:MAG: hypothetical protein ACE5F6_15105 [Anaerolineae bacterium]
MSDHMDRVLDHRKRNAMPDHATESEAPEGDRGRFDPLERLSVYLELINHAETRAQALAGMAGTALGVFFAAFIAAFVSESGKPNAILKVADLISEVLFVVGAFLLLYCMFQSLQPSQIHDPWDEDELEAYWNRVERVNDDAARSFWIGSILLALSIGILIVTDVLLDLGFFTAVPMAR